MRSMWCACLQLTLVSAIDVCADDSPELLVTFNRTTRYYRLLKPPDAVAGSALSLTSNSASATSPAAVQLYHYSFLTRNSGIGSTFADTPSSVGTPCSQFTLMTPQISHISAPGSFGARSILAFINFTYVRVYSCSRCRTLKCQTTSI